MERRLCGDSGLELSIVGLGCWAFGGGKYWGEVEQSRVNMIVRQAIDLGVNYFDTAEVYNDGRSEESLGKALRRIGREKVIIGSKIAPSNTTPDTLRKHCEASLTRLGTDYIDIYMVHWPIKSHSIRHFTDNEYLIENPPSVDEAYDTLISLQAEGKIRHIGVSNFAVSRMEEAADTGLIYVVNQLPYNLFSRAIEFKVLPYCQERNIGVVGYMTLMQGLLGNKYTDIYEMPALHRRTRHFDHDGNELIRHGEPGVEQKMQQALKKIQVMAKEQNIRMSSMAINWVLAQEGITCALTGVTDPEHLKSNIRDLESSPAPEIIHRLNQITDPLKEELGRSLDYFESPEYDRTI